MAGWVWDWLTLKHVQVGTAVVAAVLAVPGFLFGVKKLVDQVRITLDHSAVLTKLETDKMEIMAHITANRIMAAEHTDGVAHQLRVEQAQANGILLDMVAELDRKITPPAPRVAVRKKVAQGATVS